MARFFFHFRQGAKLVIDELGSEFDTVEDAYLSAYRAAQDMWRDLLVERRDPRKCSFEVSDAQNRQLFVLPFMEVLEACLKDEGEALAHPGPEPLITALQMQELITRLRNEIAHEVSGTRDIIKQTSALLEELRKFEK
jgi:hypothetical protein